jgi:hypothetical protein
MERGTWKYVRNKVIVVCPACDTGIVVELRDINDNGEVSNFECLCDFNEDITLNGYSD